MGCMPVMPALSVVVSCSSTVAAAGLEAERRASGEPPPVISRYAAVPWPEGAGRTHALEIVGGGRPEPDGVDAEDADDAEHEAVIAATSVRATTSTICGRIEPTSAAGT